MHLNLITAVVFLAATGTSARYLHGPGPNDGQGNGYKGGPKVGLKGGFKGGLKGKPVENNDYNGPGGLPWYPEAPYTAKETSTSSINDDYMTAAYETGSGGYQFKTGAPLPAFTGAPAYPGRYVAPRWTGAPNGGFSVGDKGGKGKRQEEDEEDDVMAIAGGVPIFMN